MPIISTLKDIDEAIENLGYKSETTLKCKLIRAVRKYYTDDSSFETLKAIETEDLVKAVWETGDDAELLKAKRKNFSSIKSSVNTDLKKLYQENKNPQGIIIGHNNLFDISDDAKNKALASISEIFREKGIDTSSRLTEILATLSEVLSAAATSATTAGNTKEEIERLKNIIGGLSGKLGFSLHDLIGSSKVGTDIGTASPETMDAGKGSESLQAEGEGGGSGSSAELISKSISGVNDILLEQGGDAKNKASRIMGLVNNILSDAISSAGTELNSSETAEIKNILSNIATGIDAVIPGGAGSEEFDKAKEKSFAEDGNTGLTDIGKGGAIQGLMEIIRDSEISPAMKAGKIMAQMQLLLSEAMSYAGSEINSEEAATIKEYFSDLTRKAINEAAAGFSEAWSLDKAQASAGKDKGSGNRDQELGGAEGSLPSLSTELIEKSLTGITEILRTQDTGTEGKISKIMAALNNILDHAIAAAGPELDGTEAGEIKHLFNDLASKTGVLLQESKTDADKTGAEGLQGAGSDVPDTSRNVEKIMDSIGELLSGALSGTGSDTDTAAVTRIKQLFADLAGQTGLLLKPGIVAGKGDAQGAVDKAEISTADAGWKGTGDGTESGTDGEGLTGTEHTGKAQGDTDGKGGADDFIGGTEACAEQTSAIAGTGEACGKIGGEPGKIKTTINKILSSIMDASGGLLKTEEIDRIKNLFGSLSAEVETLLETTGGLTSGDRESGSGNGEGTGGEEEDVIYEIVEDEEESPAEIVEVIEEIVSDGMAGTGSDAGESTEADTATYAQTDEQGRSLQTSGIGTGASDVNIEADEIVQIVDETSAGAGTDTEAAVGAGTGEGGGIAAATGDGRGAETPDPVQSSETDHSYDFEEVLVADDLAFSAELATQERTNAGGQNFGVEGSEGTGDTKSAAASEYEDIEIVEEFIGDEVEEIIEDQVEKGTDREDLAAAAGGPIDEDLRTKAEILAELAAAAKALEKMGPDLNSSIYSEEEIKGKAKLLSEEFDRYLTIREKFYNQHILIRGGDYLVGKANREKDELPEQLVKLREFYIGKFPVTNALFEIFVERTGYITTAERCGYGMVYVPRMQRAKNHLTGTESFSLNRQLQYKKVPGACWYHPAGPTSSLYVKRTHPVVQVSLEDACAFAAWTGKRIPTEKEWEASARTFHSYKYPWGNDWRENACNLEASMIGDTSPVDHYIKFCNDFEVADTLGNILEWTLDFWKEQAQDAEDEDIYAVKGASWISESPVSLTDRQPMYKNTSSNILGFRCIAI